MGNDSPVDVVSQKIAVREAVAVGDHRGFRVLAKIPVILRAAAAVVLAAITVCACATSVPSASPPSPSRTPSASPAPTPSQRPGTGNPYGAMPRYWAQEAATVTGPC